MIDRIDAVAADIDMTLTAKGGDLPDITRKAFNLLHSKGVKIGLATGRTIEGNLYDFGKKWNLDFEFDFIVGLNGGMVYNREKDTLWSIDKMTIADMKAILTYMMPLIDKYKIAINAEGGNTNAMNIGADLIASSRRHGFNFIDKTGDIDGFCDTRAYKMLFRTTPEHDHEIRETFLKKFGDRFQIVGTFPGTVEVMQKGVNKGTGLQKYADQESIAMKNIITFGDSENDDAMLRKSGWGVCLKDGTDGTKACADAITDYDCADGGVGHYLFDHYITPKGITE